MSDTMMNSIKLRTSMLEQMDDGSGNFAETMDNIGMMSAVTAASDDYKAMIFLFLPGGMDYANAVTPYDQASYNLYSALRPTIAHSRDSLGGTILTPTTALSGGLQYALHPALAPLMPIWNAGRMATLLNVGTLTHPLTKTQFLNGTVPAPPKIFSHNDQQNFFQASAPEGAATGWGGRISDLMEDGNSIRALTSICINGNAVFLAGNTATQYTMGQNGPLPLLGDATTLYGSPGAMQRMREMVTSSRNSLLITERAKIASRALTNYSAVANGLGGVSEIGNSVNGAIRMVLKMIAAASTLGQKRQVFFVTVPGWDHHDNLITQLTLLLGIVANVIRTFHDATEALGIADKVTLFTGSDFGRTLVENGDGSDHGWGSHHFVVGGAVKGKQFYGTPPLVGDNTDDDVGQGRLLPTTSVDQYAATLAKWFGVSASDMSTVLPNIGHYSNQNLGFMNAP